MVLLLFDRLPLLMWGLCFGVALGWWLFQSRSPPQTTSGREQYEPARMSESIRSQLSDSDIPVERIDKRDPEGPVTLLISPS
ncbi:hypothetical protein [Halocatena pleomorpha]|uniref:Uncharacterized protein n=1 Tax=Halocatena pleomorpha TaxID=1785090 RepID=A0A3P3R5E8_9EURY|nr:hypothetical protein [Halocatena pleomorpha]RRJ28702.1 hypothetical protein EIK79_14935 [Halocatena pleomorpha]